MLYVAYSLTTRKGVKKIESSRDGLHFPKLSLLDSVDVRLPWIYFSN